MNMNGEHVVSSKFDKRFRRNFQNGVYASLSGLAVRFFSRIHLLVFFHNFCTNRYLNMNVAYPNASNMHIAPQ